MPFLAGFLAGYLVYDMIHYHVHHHWPRTRVGRRLRELHMRHHFQDDERGFGVSAPYWDHVFGTPPEERCALNPSTGRVTLLGRVSTEPENQPAAEEGEVVDGLPVPVDAARRPRARPPGARAGRPGGGARGDRLRRRRRDRGGRRPAPPRARRRRRKKKGGIGEIVGSNSFLVDVHLVRRD